VNGPNDALRQLYQAIIVEHGKSPRHQGPLPGATHEATVDNPLCGDQVTLRLVMDGDLIREAAFEARGCTLSVAAASLLATQLRGAAVADARATIERFQAFVAEPADAPLPDLGDLTAFAGVREFKSRRACATLPALAFLRATAR
jgi:nitrogen fixation NifU-like protein